MADDRPEIDLYTRDFYAWTQVQAEALRGAAPGASNVIEWARVAEELEDLGSAEWNRCWTLLARIVQHLHKLENGPAAQPRAKWRSEVREFRLTIERSITRSIRNGMEQDLEAIHQRGRRLAQGDLSDHDEAATLEASRRWTLAQLLGETSDPLDEPEFAARRPADV